MIGGGSEGDGDLHLVEGRKRVNEREREIRDGGIVGWFFGGGKFRDLFRWKVGRWACVLLSRLLGRLLLRRFRLPISPVFENFFRGCLRFPAPLSRINESATEREGKTERKGGR